MVLSGEGEGDGSGSGSAASLDDGRNAPAGYHAAAIFEKSDNGDDPPPSARQRMRPTETTAMHLEADVGSQRSATGAGRHPPPPQHRRGRQDDYSGRAAKDAVCGSTTSAQLASLAPQITLPLSENVPAVAQGKTDAIERPRFTERVVGFAVSPNAKKRSYHLRCWIMCPLVTLLVAVFIVSIALGVVTSQQNSQSVLESLHSVVLANMETSVGRLTLMKIVRMVLATGSMYFSNNTFPNPLTDRLMPLEGEMMSRLCALLRDMDPKRQMSVFGAVSLTRKQAAICLASRSRPGRYIGAVSHKGMIDDFYYVDPLTLEFHQPPEPYVGIVGPATINEYTNFFHFDTVVDIWRESIRKGETMNLSQHWVTPRYPPTYAAFVYPFFETYDNGDVGVGYLYMTMRTGKLTSLYVYNASESGIRVMLVDPNATSERHIVFANSWGQPLSNVTDDWKATAKGEPIEFMNTESVTDPVMREAIRHVDLHAVIGSGQKQDAYFSYGGFDGMITAEYIATGSGVSMVLVVVTSRSFHMGPVNAYRDAAIAAGTVVLLLVTGACMAFVEYCLHRPLRATQAELKQALSGAPVGAKGRGRVMLREVRELEDVCNTLRRHLDDVRSYMPDRLLAENNVSSTGGTGSNGPNLRGYDMEASTALPGDELRRVMCSVAYVYYTPRTTPNPVDAVVELMMLAVVETATECGGCFEVQRPDCCVVSFGVQSKSKNIAAEASDAVEFARRLSARLSACCELAGQYRVIVESGAFLSGVVSGGGRSHFVLLCRNLHYRIGGFLPHAGVVAAATEETAVLVRGRFRLLPFETVYLDEAGEKQVLLHEVIGGNVGAAGWQDYEHCHDEAFSGMMRGDFSSALWWWDKARAVEQSALALEPPSCRSTQLERLRSECATRVARGDTAPYAHRPQAAHVEGGEVLCGAAGPMDHDSACDGLDFSCLTVSSSNAGATNQTEEDSVCGDVTAGRLPHCFKDRNGDTWKRAVEPVVNAVADVTPVYMAMSATGTLAVLKVCPLTEVGGRLPRAELDTALEALLGVEQSDSLVQHLSYCHAPPHGVVLVTEFVPGGSLRDMKGRYGRALPLMAVKRNVASVLRGLAHLHDRGLVHGRVCPENVMVGVEGRCRLKGMLLAAAPLLVHHDSYYVSPEEAASGTKTMAGDMYALGLLLLAMLRNTHPWHWAPHAAVERSHNEIASLLADGPMFRAALRDGLLVPAPPPADVDDTMRGVLDACLRAVPAERPSATELLGTFDL